ncbi:MAG TPA: DeoR/GlpR family DNA-binding transcription regulator [Vicinamibacteria bacterium]|nr:DeoR/GlpR family DNA-binding transcription regulator [Vicinamibacteria bacterium]
MPVALKAPARRLRIRELLEGSEFVDLSTLCRLLDSSESSVRRDLIALEGEGLLRRVHGGALSRRTGKPQADFASHSRSLPEEKARIARLAASLIEDGQTVILDGGSTVAAVARELVERTLRVVTNSLPIAEVLEEARGVDVTLTGGYLDRQWGVMLGPVCEQMLGELAADVAVMGIGGVTEKGFSNNNPLVVGSERKMIEVSRRVMIVADHTKFGRGAMVPVAPLEVADVVVSDTGLPAPFQARLRAHDIEVKLA